VCFWSLIFFRVVFRFSLFFVCSRKKGAAQAQANEMQIKITQIIYTLFKPRHRACACDCVRLRCGNEQCVHYTAERLGLEIGHFFASANDLVAFGSIQSVLIVCFWSLIFFRVVFRFSLFFVCTY